MALQLYTWGIRPNDGALHTEGVAFMLTPQAHRALISWEPINPRLITTKCRNNHKRIATVMMQRYAPTRTNDAEEEEKNKSTAPSAKQWRDARRRISSSSWEALMRKLGKITPGVNELREDTNWVR